MLRKHYFLVRFLRIHPVQSVVNSIAQHSGRGFPRIFHMKLFFVATVRSFGTPKRKSGRVIWTFEMLEI